MAHKDPSRLEQQRHLKHWVGILSAPKVHKDEILCALELFPALRGLAFRRLLEHENELGTDLILEQIRMYPQELLPEVNQMLKEMGIVIGKLKDSEPEFFTQPTGKRPISKLALLLGAGIKASSVFAQIKASAKKRAKQEGKKKKP